MARKRREQQEDVEMEEDSSASSSSDSEPARPSVENAPSSSSESESEQEEQEQEQEQEQVEESEDDAEEMEVDGDGEGEEGEEEEKEKEKGEEETSSSSDSEEEEATPVVQAQEQSSDSEEEAEENVVQKQEESSDSSESGEEDVEEETTPVVQSKDESSDSEDSEEEEEEATPALQQQEESSDSSDSEDEVETKPRGLVKQESSDTSDSEDEVEQEVVEPKQESSDSSDSEDEVEQEVVETKQESSESSDSEDEAEQEAKPVVQSKQESPDSSDSEEEKEEKQEQPTRQSAEKRKPVKVLTPMKEGPPKKKAKLETLKSNEEKMLRRILQPLSKGQLLETIIAAALKYHELYADLTTTAENVLSQRKVAVHGLAPETETIKLKQRFITFGKVEDATIIRDKSSGKSLGFGYVTFAESKAAQQAIRTLKIKVDGREVSCSLAKAGDDANEKPPTNAVLAPQQPREGRQANAVDRKLFVRLLAKTTSKDTLRKAFEKFGEVEHVHVMWDHATNQSKCCGFVVFREKAGADSALRFSTVKIDGNYVKYNLAAEGKKASADLSPDRTLMVRALAKKTSNDTLRKAFEKFGEVESTHVVRNRSTNASKGYGFVTFREKAGADNALKTPTMKIDGNNVAYALAGEGKRMSPDEAPNRTLQVLSLSKKTTTDTLRKEYEKFGIVENAFVVWDHAKNENKGYGFVTYRAKAGADNALKSPAMKIDGHDVVHALASEGEMHHLKEANARSLIVRHISRSKTTEESLRETFEQFGEVESTHVVRDTETGESKGFGFVTFREKAAALQVPQKSIKLHGKKVLCLPRMAHR